METYENEAPEPAADADDQDAGPTTTAEQIDQADERDQAEGG